MINGKRAMKKFILILAVIFTGIVTQAQELFNYNPAVDPGSLPPSMLEISDSAYAGAIDLSVLSLDQLALSVPGHETAYFNVLEKDKGKWIGNKTDNQGDIVLIVNENKIVGTITIGLVTYQICSINDNTAALIKINHGKYLEYDIPVGLRNTTPNLSTHASGTSQEKLRILVAYTPGAAQNALPDIMSRVRLAIEETNKTFINSEVDHRIELAACLPVNYSPKGDFSEIVSQFAGSKEGDMGKIHQLRDACSADICVLFTDPGGMGCGAPLQLLADSNTAFCVVRSDCATGNYSLAQMLGYLIGAGDNKDNVSFSYGQGYISWNHKWKTIMAYDNNLPRVNYWSNITVSLPADNDNRMGWINQEDNARVLNERMNTAKAFRVTPDNLSFNTVPSGSPFYLEAPANDFIRIEGNVVIGTDNELHLQAGNKITLTSGFQAKKGSRFTASLLPIPVGLLTSRSATDIRTTEISEEKETVLTLAPNPVMTEGYLSYRLTKNQRISILIRNSSGICVKKLLSDRLQDEGEYTFSFNRSGLPAGSYFITLMTENSFSVVKALFL